MTIFLSLFFYSANIFKHRKLRKVPFTRSFNSWDTKLPKDEFRLQSHFYLVETQISPSSSYADETCFMSIIS